MGEPFREALLSQIVSSDERLELRGRRRRIRVALAVAAAAVASVLGGVALTGSPAAADVIVTIDGDTVRVELTDLDSSPREVVAALAKAGVDASVDEQPVGPSNVGAFVGAGFPNAFGLRINRVGGSESAFRVFEFPRRNPGGLVVALGRPALPGEMYAVPSDAFQPGEPLHCSGLRGDVLAESLGDLRGLEVFVSTAASPSPLALDRGRAGVDRRVIESALAIAPDSVVLQLADPGSSVDDEPCSAPRPG